MASGAGGDAPTGAAHELAGFDDADGAGLADATESLKRATVVGPAGAGELEEPPYDGELDVDGGGGDGDDAEEDDDEDDGPHQSYGQADYWDKRYADDVEQFDWLLQWRDFERAGAHKLVPRDSRLLMVGCGNATFSSQMYDSGITRDIHNIDLSSVVVDQMRTANAEREDMKYYVMNARHLDFGDESFDVTFDKSTMDCLFCCDDSVEACRDMVCECHRVLRMGGKHIVLSLHGIDKVLPYLQSRGVVHWDIEYMEIPNPRYDGPESGRSPVHMLFVCTKTPRPAPEADAEADREDGAAPADGDGEADGEAQ